MAYGQIEAIERIPEVERVFLETQYEPDVVQTDLPADPHMSTSPSMIGSNGCLLYTSRQGVQCFEASSGIHVPDAQSAIIRSTDALPPIGRHGNCVDPVSMSFQCV